MADHEVKLLLVGFGGYGNIYAGDLLNDPACPPVKIVGVVDPMPENGKYFADYQTRGIPFYPSMDAFFENDTADLAVISTPIQFHTAHILQALAHGCHVLCEKPLCGDPADVDRLIAARDAAGKQVYIGFQWSHSKAIQALKADVMAGKFGAPLEFKTLILWPRDDNYWGRTTKWAGKIKAADGSLIYDSVANNAAAHYLHNMFYVLGDAVNTAQAPTALTADLLRVNPIENFDTARIVCTMQNGAKLHFIASHTIDENVDPMFCYQFEKGTVYFSGEKTPEEKGIHNAAAYEYHCVKAVMNDGTVIRYGDPFLEECRKMHLAIRAAGGETVGELCGIETAAVHTRTIGRLQTTQTIHDVKKTLIERKDGLFFVKGLRERLIDAYERPETGALSDFFE